MDDSQKRKSRLEIGHVLFIDIAGCRFEKAMIASQPKSRTSSDLTAR